MRKNSFRIKNEWLYTLRTFNISLLFISIFTYGMKKADELFAEKKCMTYSVSNFDALVSVASAKKYIKKKDIDKICEWIDSPETWGKRYGFEK